MKAGLGAALVPVIAAFVPPELMNATSTEEIFDIVSSTNSESLLSVLPKELSGENMTLDNFYKWFNFTAHHEVIGEPTGPTRPGDVSSLSESWKNVSAEAGVDPMDLVNIFKDAWDFVEHNKPVVDIAQGNYAAAIPRGVSWRDIAFDREPYQSASHRFYWRNCFTQIAHVQYKVHRYCHGSYGGTSDAFMTQVTQITESAEAGFGCTVYAHSHVSNPTNVGSNSGSVLSELTMQLEIGMPAGTKFYENYAIRADGSMETLSSQVLEAKSPEVLV